MGANASAVCPVRRDATQTDDGFSVIFYIPSNCFRPYANPSVSDLAFYQLLRPGLEGKNTTTDSTRCPFPVRILSNLDVDMEFYPMRPDYRYEGD